MSKPSILVLSGSLKKDSSNNRLLAFFAEKFHAEARFIDHINLADLPHFNPEIVENDVSEIVKTLRTEIESADAVLISTPEYVFSMPAVLKNTLEWCVSTEVFTDKPVGIIVGAASGQKAMEQLVLVLSTIQCKLSAETQLVISGIKGKVNPTINKELQTDLSLFMSKLLEFWNTD